MAWTTPITAVANSTFTATQWNAGVRDNLAIQAPAIATTNGWLICSNGANVIVQREVAQVVNDALGTTTSTTYTPTLTGGGTSPAITFTTGTGALLFMSMNIAMGLTNASAAATIDVNGDGGNDNRSLIQDGDGAFQRDDRVGCSQAFLLGTPGSNTYQLEYRVTAGTGTFINRRLVGIAL